MAYIKVKLLLVACVETEMEKLQYDLYIHQ